MRQMSHRFTISAALALALIATPALFASNPKAVPDRFGESARVISHIPTSGPPATRLFTQNHNGRRYLYVDQGAVNGVTVVDVTRPSHPVVLQRTNWPANSAAGDLQFVGGDLAIAETPTARPVRPNTVNILDVSDAGHPAVLQTFAGVTSVLADPARNLVYVANPEGVWVVRHRISQSGWAARHQCTSEDAIRPIPDCY